MEKKKKRVTLSAGNILFQRNTNSRKYVQISRYVCAKECAGKEQIYKIAKASFVLCP